MKYSKLILTIALCSTALCGDYLVFKSKYSESQVFRAFLDNFVHASIGFLSSLLFFSHEINVTNYACLCNVIFCTVVSSLIDIDHVIVAKSFYLKISSGSAVHYCCIGCEDYRRAYRWRDMANLKQRGIFHCTTLLLLISTCLLLYSHFTNKLNLYIASWMLIIAYTSHHIRDGNRRGLWLYPFGHTPPIDKYLYVILIAAQPYLYVILYKSFEPVFRHTVVEHSYKMLV